ncbi:hypothetical protein [Acinetobacter rudis]|uniref:Uncharacterized protein n=1 Tax=Acinetobacter rudis CIP 110305 TaxID=421052 RepID=S3NC43_9GAMM|nr:hypothetical protein [Acinetobacter rudis]EPF71929.1 hypothetical protein F945_02275 [Acinetobacter rudis CIP 110305]
MNKTIRRLMLFASLVCLYGMAFLIYINTSTGLVLFGVIPEFFVYLIFTYFISSILIEIMTGEEPFKNVKVALKKASILLVVFLLYAVTYWLFYKYIIVANHLENTLLGEHSYLVFIFLMVFFGIRFSKKLYLK